MTLGLIGCGRMGTALALGALRSKAVTASDLLAFDINPRAVEALITETGAAAASTLPEAITRSEVLLLCTKPHDIPTVLEEVATHRSSDDCPLILSIAAGVTIATMEQLLNGCARVIRAMPNTPALVGQGAAAFALGSTAHEKDGKIATTLLGAVGEVIQVEESLLDVVTGLSGSGPAYTYLFIEALIKAGISHGLSPEQAGTLATQTVLGAATMVRDTGRSPADLREMVSSPGGTTLAGLSALEEANFRQICHEAVHAATRRSQELGQS